MATTASPDLTSTSLTDALTTAIPTTISATSSLVLSTLKAASTQEARPSTANYIPMDSDVNNAQAFEGMGLRKFLAALAFGAALFVGQLALFLLLRNKLARIFKPKTYLVPERERTNSPPRGPWTLLLTLMKTSDRDVINKCGLDAFFFLRYLRTLLVIFVPMAALLLPILIPLNYVNGKGKNVIGDSSPDSAQPGNSTDVKGLDTLAWANITPANSSRYWAHLILAILVILWVCTVFFFELRVYVKVRHDYLTSAEHRLRASATTVLVNDVPSKWLTEEALRGLFDVFPGGIRNVWLNRDLTKLLEKINRRKTIHNLLEHAETELVKMAKKEQLKRSAIEEKKMRKQSRRKSPTKEEIALREKQADEQATRMAQAGGGISSGEHPSVPHNISEAIEESREQQRRSMHQGKGFPVPIIGQGLSKVGQGFKTLSQGVEKSMTNTNGFTAVGATDEPSSRPATGRSDPSRGSPPSRFDERPSTANQSEVFMGGLPRPASNVSQDRLNPDKSGSEPRVTINTVRKMGADEDMVLQDETKWWQFWKPPPGGYASPVPQGGAAVDRDEENNDGSEGDTLKGLWTKVSSGMNSSTESPDYPAYSNADYKEAQEEEGEWANWIKPKSRPTHRVARFDWTPGWLPGLPFINKKVDTIYWCREELARLNMEIEEDQKEPERYPLMNSAFIQFNQQVAAHMACQSLSHHIPKKMTPRMLEISPNDVIWDNMALKWWQEWLRSTIVTWIVITMVFLWAIPVGFTASLGEIDSLVARFTWLSFLKTNESVQKIAAVVVGVLPAFILTLLLLLVPFILGLLANFKGVKTGAQKAEFIQQYYFVFLFVQVFLVVSVSSFFAASVDVLFRNITSLMSGTTLLDLLAENLPKASNYFFNYMILQALSTSAGTLLQTGGLFMWYVIAKMTDTTARDKWNRNTSLANIKWGSFFPVYTNFACIALIYSVIAPLICIFAIITFGLFWVAQRYGMLYVYRFSHDTGGVLYPRAINQTFTGLYVMELCLAGLFFIVKDEDGNLAATPQGVIMIVSIVSTGLYQWLLNRSFGPLFRYLPITFEDEACIRDQIFQQEQNRRLGLLEEDDDDGNNEKVDDDTPGFAIPENDIASYKGLNSKKFNPFTRVRELGGRAKEGVKSNKAVAMGVSRVKTFSAAEYRKKRRDKDLESQRAIGEALFGGYHDEIEDLTPDERDALVRYAFQHYALRSRRPTVWLPRDDVGISDDEIRRTRNFSDYIWISNEGTALDSKLRVVYGTNPPDFTEVDLINL